MKTFIEPDPSTWGEIIRRPSLDNAELKNTVRDILEDVRTKGDSAIKKYNKKFNETDISNLKVSKEELDCAEISIAPELKEAINNAINNIEKFHSSQIETVKFIETTKGVKCWRKSVAIERVGLYVPGGTAPLFSTLLMLAIPAKLAGCPKIIVCTPPGNDGSVNNIILYVAHILGLEYIYKIGGVQAIAAMAYGTESIPKVHKIFGPGNQYVTAAKQMINSQGISIDMPAGPSEVAVYADETSNPSFVAADLLSQAEHGSDSQVIFVARSIEIANHVKIELEKQIVKLNRTDFIVRCLEKSICVIINDVNSAFELLNDYAPEHLIIASDYALPLSEKVINAGSVFLGHYSPESVGDYASGTNHTLPTNGYAKAYSGVSLDSFVKKITFQHIEKQGIETIGKTVQIMAAAEGLDAHKNAVSVRLQSLIN